VVDLHAGQGTPQDRQVIVGEGDRWPDGEGVAQGGDAAHARPLGGLEIQAGVTVVVAAQAGAVVTAGDQAVGVQRDAGQERGAGGRSEATDRVFWRKT